MDAAESDSESLHESWRDEQAMNTDSDEGKEEEEASAGFTALLNEALDIKADWPRSSDTSAAKRRSGAGE
jgi:hypothetical protein